MRAHYARSGALRQSLAGREFLNHVRDFRWCRRAGLNCRPQPYQGCGPLRLVASRAANIPYLASLATVFAFCAGVCAHYARASAATLPPDPPAMLSTTPRRWVGENTAYVDLVCSTVS